jgi:uncharacterized protein YqhQ
MSRDEIEKYNAEFGEYSLRMLMAQTFKKVENIEANQQLIKDDVQQLKNLHVNCPGSQSLKKLNSKGMEQIQFFANNPFWLKAIIFLLVVSLGSNIAIEIFKYFTK